MSNLQLTPEDLKAIAEIQERLSRFSKLQPTAKDEVRYVECIEPMRLYKKGEIYTVTPFTEHNNTPMVNSKDTLRVNLENYQQHFKPSTLSAYQAQQQVEDVKERWKPKMFDVYFFIKEDFTIHCTKYSHPILDDPKIAAGNCFKTEAEANEIATKIKALLQTL